MVEQQSIYVRVFLSLLWQGLGSKSINFGPRTQKESTCLEHIGSESLQFIMYKGHVGFNLHKFQLV